MLNLSNEQTYLNCFAVVLNIIHKHTDLLAEIKAAEIYEESTTKLKEQLDNIFILDDMELLSELQSTINTICSLATEPQLIQAIELCKYLDSKITYKKEEYSNKKRLYVSLSHIIDLDVDQTFFVSSLNTNVEETKIWLNPKFEICRPHVKHNGHEEIKNISNRNIFIGINGELHNCSYYPYDKKNHVYNVIIPPPINNEKKKILKVGFSPLSDKPDILNTYTAPFIRKGINQTGIFMSPISYVDDILNRLHEAFDLACKNKIDVLFFPEMLGFEKIEVSRANYNETISSWSLNYQEKCDDSQINLPSIICLPSYWHDNSNIVTVTNGSGQIIGHQEKHIPFSSQKEHQIEALDEKDIWNTLIIHVPNRYRIAIMICAEFLYEPKENLFDFICGCLEASIIVVPSYSRGEMDFINQLSTLKMYGTTVIWGNCCGAIKTSEKAIGGCGIAGTNLTYTLGEFCKCNHSCNNNQSCLFTIEIPLDYEYSKTSCSLRANISHIIH